MRYAVAHAPGQVTLPGRSLPLPVVLTPPAPPRLSRTLLLFPEVLIELGVPKPVIAREFPPPAFSFPEAGPPVVRFDILTEPPVGHIAAPRQIVAQAAPTPMAFTAPTRTSGVPAVSVGITDGGNTRIDMVPADMWNGPRTDVEQFRVLSISAGTWE